MKKYYLVPLMVAAVLFLVSCGPKPAEIHQQVFTVDTHVDTPVSRDNGFHISRLNDREKGGGQVDFPRMKQGGLDAICQAIFLRQGDRSPEAFQKSVERAEKDFKDILQVTKDHPDLVELALTPEDAYRIEKSGKRVLFISIENGYNMGLDLSLIQKYYDYGLRVSGLCHGKNNEICDSSTDEPEHGGLSEVGKKVVAEMNRLGIVLDMSHVSDDTFYDVIKVSKVPIVATHSCCRALCDTSRNMTDDMLKKLGENGGVIQICLLSFFVDKNIPQVPEREKLLKELEEKYKDWEKKPDDMRKYFAERRDVDKQYPPKLATIADAVDHIDHVVKLIGIDHVGIGSDFDGGGGLADLRDVSGMAKITEELVKRGYTREEIRKIWGGNFMRVMKQVQDHARALKSSI